MRGRKWWLLLVPALVIFLPWAGMLKTEEYDQCEHCLAIRFRDRAFWYGMNYSSMEYPWTKSLRSQVCVALDRPCSHDLRWSFVRKRMWGGIYCACPCINGTVTIHFDDWLTPERSAAIERVAAKDPEFAEEFVRRCLAMKDQEFFKETAQRIEAELDKGSP